MTPDLGPQLPEIVRLRLVGTGADRLVINGPVTGRRYEFFRTEGTIVDAADVDGFLLMVARSTSCCGSPATPAPLVERV